MPERDNAKPAQTRSQPEPSHPSSPSPNAVQPAESQDASKPGQNPVAQSQTLRQNVPGDGGEAEGSPAEPAGLHATGSYAGKESKEAPKKP